MKVAYRPYAQRMLAGKMNVPHIKAVRVGDRPAILFSREDLSAGLVGQSVGGVLGYTPASATELVRRFVFRAAGMKLPEPAQPTSKPAKSDDKAKKEKKEKKPAAEAPDVVKNEPAKAEPAKPAPAATEGSGLD